MLWCMTTLSNEEVAEFQRIAEEDGVIPGLNEAREAASWLLFVYERLALLTPKEVEERRQRRQAAENALAPTAQLTQQESCSALETPPLSSQADIERSSGFLRRATDQSPCQ